MDMITVDITDAPEAGIGSPVELWGELVSIDEVAGLANTISYELFCRLTKRVPRVNLQ
jgi:alanine racemase